MVSRSARAVVGALMGAKGAVWVRDEADTLVFEAGEYGPDWQAAYDEAERIVAELGIDVAVV